MGKLDIITVVIIAANVLISYKGFNDFSFFEKYKFNVGGLKRGERIRLFSAGFLHVDMQHLLFNMVTLYFFSGLVILKLGSIGFLTVYIGSLLVGNFLSYYFHKDEYHYSAVGASGAVMGIIYSAILFEPMMKINFFIPGFAFGIGYLLYSIYGMKKRIGNIGHDAHFGGAVGGYLFTLLLSPSLFQTSLLFVLLLAIPIVILFVLQKMGKI
ncbi:rhomboid family intramembrane serine protease [Hyunsoonleella sp. 2307UL5-6]|uniref:rhomboid family intramembrane serine protease n=1 Tax=Hyunsoonleella sp. 2307UL5-6 TaxID=3384768 RepID=UPI0039BC7C9D